MNSKYLVFLFLLIFGLALSSPGINAEGEKKEKTQSF